MPFCNQCGQQLNVEDAFCDVCGTPVRQSSDNQDQQQYENSVNTEITATPLCVDDTNSVENFSLWGYFIKCFKLYCSFKGRASRKEYWGFVLFSLLLFCLLAVLLVVYYIILSDIDYKLSMYSYFFLNLFLIPPYISVSVRRLHDIGKNGWIICIFIIPILLWLFTFNKTLSDLLIVCNLMLLFIWLNIACTKGNIEKNKYGVNPIEKKYDL